MKTNKPLDYQLTISKKRFILKIEVNCHMKFAVIIIILMLAAGIAGFTVGSLKPSSNSTLPTLIQTTAKSKLTFQSQTAMVQGKVVAVSGNLLTVADQKNQTDQFQASSKLIIFRPAANKLQPASPSSDLKSIDLNQNALITFELVDNKYQLISITYIPNPAKP